MDPGDPRSLPVVTIRSSGRHPTIFRKMVEGVSSVGRPSEGDLVKVVDRSGLHLGYGLWNGRSEIRVRMLTGDPTPPVEAFWRGRLESAIALRRQILRLDDVTNAYRVVHAEGDGLSGLIADRFAEVVSVEVFSLGVYQRLDALAGLLRELSGADHVLARVDEHVAEAEGFRPQAWESAGAPERVVIHEHGTRFKVQFAGGHKTGFFCDQRENRKMLCRFTADRRVLDVCCYTGGFAVQAKVLGGAGEVTGVDLDEKAIALARENANLNQARIQWIHADAFGYMRQMGINGRTFDVIVLDPPKLIPTRLDVAEGKRKYFDLNVLAMRLVEPGGILLTCSCSGLLPAFDFLALLNAAARKAGRTAQVLEVAGAAPDHPVRLDALEGAYLKAVWLRVESGPIEADSLPSD